jgi:hypothetical protein
VLVQHPETSGKKKKEWEAIGLYLNKGNGILFKKKKERKTKMITIHSLCIRVGFPTVA